MPRIVQSWHRWLVFFHHVDQPIRNRASVKALEELQEKAKKNRSRNLRRDRQARSSLLS